MADLSDDTLLHPSNNILLQIITAASTPTFYSKYPSLLAALSNFLGPQPISSTHPLELPPSTFFYESLQSSITCSELLDWSKSLSLQLISVHKCNFYYTVITPEDIIVTKDRKVLLRTSGLAQSATTYEANSIFNDPEQYFWEQVKSISPEKYQKRSVDPYKANFFSLGLMLLYIFRIDILGLNDLICGEFEDFEEIIRNTEVDDMHLVMECRCLEKNKIKPL